MATRFTSIYFRYLKSDWWLQRHPELKHVPFALSIPSHGRLVISAVNNIAEEEGIYEGIAVADARALVPGLAIFDDDPELESRLLKKIAEWCIRFTPHASVDHPKGILLDSSGCAHLWNGEYNYASAIQSRLRELGYQVNIGIADTIGCAWAAARFSKEINIVDTGQQRAAMMSMPPRALRIQPETTEKLMKLGLQSIKHLLDIPLHSLHKRFGDEIVNRIRQALGEETESIHPVHETDMPQERLQALDPVNNAGGIKIALSALLKSITSRLAGEGLGIRSACFSVFTLDGISQQIKIGTNRASNNPDHLYRLFEEKIQTIQPGLGIELFRIAATQTEKFQSFQQNIWEGTAQFENHKVNELIDRFISRLGQQKIFSYLPAQHYWPERSLKKVFSFSRQKAIHWWSPAQRPLYLLSDPLLVQVAAPIPDYPPILFRYKGKVHKIKKADGPERIEQEWWLSRGEHRDYYVVEDEEGARYWLFRLGHYNEKEPARWFLHGLFA